MKMTTIRWEAVKVHKVRNVIPKEVIDRCNEYLCIYGRLSIPFIQSKCKLGYKEAKRVYEYFNRFK